MDTIRSAEQPKRVVWIDYAKFIGIFLVIFAHQTSTKGIFMFVSAFDMPLFFFLSGFLFSFNKYENYAIFLKARVGQLLVPYLLMNLVTYPLWLVFFRDFDPFFYTNVPFYKPLIGIFYGNSIDDYLVHCIASWFIICLFTLENIYFLVYRNAMGIWKYVLMAVFLVMSILDHKYNTVRFPWELNTAVVGIIFYSAGNIFKTRVKDVINLPVPALIAIAICSVTVLTYISSKNYIDMAMYTYGNMKLFYIGAFAGILFTLALCKVLEILFGHIRFIQYIAQNTLTLIGFHLFIMTLLTHAIAFIFAIPLDMFRDNVYLCLLMVLINLLFSVPLIYLFNRYFPAIIGKPVWPIRWNGTSKQVVPVTQQIRKGF